MALRKRQRTDAALDTVDEQLTVDDLPASYQDWYANPAQRLLDGELRAELERALSQLPESLRVVFVLRDAH